MSGSIIDILEESWIGRIIGIAVVLFITVLALLVVLGLMSIEEYQGP